MRILYEPYKPRTDAAEAIAHATRICRAYATAGYDLTLRQLYYQFVAHDLFPASRTWSWDGARWRRDPNGTKNAEPNYDWLGEVINKARMGGLLDWDYIVDRTRRVRAVSHWADADSIVSAAADSFRMDKWTTQNMRVEIWVEKEALAGIVQGIADERDVAWFSCRGYVSQSEQWGAAQRLGQYLRSGQRVVVLHLGDHDPSGIDMTRDNRDRLRTFIAQDWLNDQMPTVQTATTREIWQDIGMRVSHLEPLEIRRVALNMDQIEHYDPPPNPTKLTDSRAGGYIAEHGYESYELDALDPPILTGLIGEHLDELCDYGRYDLIETEESEHRRLLAQASERWDEIVELMSRES